MSSNATSSLNFTGSSNASDSSRSTAQRKRKESPISVTRDGKKGSGERKPIKVVKPKLPNEVTILYNMDHTICKYLDKLGRWKDWRTQQWCPLPTGTELAIHLNEGRFDGPSHNQHQSIFEKFWPYDKVVPGIVMVRNRPDTKDGNYFREYQVEINAQHQHEVKRVESAHCACGTKNFKPYCDDCNHGYVKRSFDAYFMANSEHHQEFGGTLPQRLEMNNIEFLDLDEATPEPNVLGSNPSSSHGAPSPSAVFAPQKNIELITAGRTTEFFVMSGSACPTGQNTPASTSSTIQMQQELEQVKTQALVSTEIQRLANRRHLIDPSEMEALELLGAKSMTEFDSDIAHNNAREFWEKLSKLNPEFRSLIHTATGWEMASGPPTTQFEMRQWTEKQKAISETLAQLRAAYAAQDAEYKMNRDYDRAMFQSVIDHTSSTATVLQGQLINMENNAMQQSGNTY